MNWKTAHTSDIGGRSEQQDRIAVLNCSKKKALLMVVADGMGGHKEGALAAQTVIETSSRLFADARRTDPIESLNDIVLESHAAIRKIQYGNGRAPGSTAVLLYITGNMAYWAHAGDSRLYHFRDRAVRERTLDHSMAQLLINDGTLDESEIANSPLQNQLYMCLGGDRPPATAFGSCAIQDCDYFLLCSDGFWANITTDEVFDRLAKQPLSEAVDQLVKHAAKNGGPEGDNVSLALTKIELPHLTPYSRILNLLNAAKECVT